MAAPPVLKLCNCSTACCLLPSFSRCIPRHRTSDQIADQGELTTESRHTVDPKPNSCTTRELSQLLPRSPLIAGTVSDRPLKCRCILLKLPAPCKRGSWKGPTGRSCPGTDALSEASTSFVAVKSSLSSHVKCHPWPSSFSLPCPARAQKLLPLLCVWNMASTSFEVLKPVQGLF